jgi:hypothetical protein
MNSERALNILWPIVMGLSAIAMGTHDLLLVHDTYMRVSDFFSPSAEQVRSQLRQESAQKRLHLLMDQTQEAFRQAKTTSSAAGLKAGCLALNNGAIEKGRRLFRSAQSPPVHDFAAIRWGVDLKAGIAEALLRRSVCLGSPTMWVTEDYMPYVVEVVSLIE